jgi:hypothetical protein
MVTGDRVLCDGQMPRWGPLPHPLLSTFLEPRQVLGSENSPSTRVGLIFGGSVGLTVYVVQRVRAWKMAAALGQRKNLVGVHPLSQPHVLVTGACLPCPSSGRSYFKLSWASWQG